MESPVENNPTGQLHLDSNQNFSLTAAFSNASNNSNPSLISNSSPRPKSIKNKQFIQAEQPYGFEFLNLIRRENALPFRFYGLDLIDTVRTNYPFIYRINDGVSTNTILQQVCEERGWVEFKDPVKLNQREREVHSDVGWNMWWSYNFYQSSPYRTLKIWQYTNHNPRAFQFCNKSYLTSFLRKMLHEYGETFDFSPKGFVMPDDYVRFVSEHVRRTESNCPNLRNVVTFPASNTVLNSRPDSAQKQCLKGVKSPVWISKPIGKSQGKGIYLTTEVGVIANENRSVVQEYISRPLLIGGYKWDIRIYVCVASTDPLVVYIYREGLCRFATEKYDLSNLTANFSHLTNASLNKLGPDYPTEKDVVGSGCKWSLRRLRKYFKECGISDWFLWQRIMSIVVLTVIGEALRSGFSYPANKNCFDFFGFDILVDETLRPWLLEVNYSPGLGGDCFVDEVVKKPMLHELFNLLKFPSSNDGPTSSTKPPRQAAMKSKLMFFENSIRSPIPSVEKKKKSIDCSCEARLKEVSSIYTQDLVSELIERYSRNPYFKLTRNMKAILSKKQQGVEFKSKLTKKNANVRKTKPEIEKVALPLETATEIIDSNDEHGSNVLSSERKEIPGEISSPSNHPNGDPRKKKSEGSYLYLKRQDWLNPPKTSGDWVLVYPCRAYPYKSPYRSSLTDLRGIVKIVDNYLKISEFVFQTYPENKDDFYMEKIKALCRWDIEVWLPPEDESI